MANQNWKAEALALAKTGKSWRKIAKEIGVPRSTVSDMLRKEFKDSGDSLGEKLLQSVKEMEEGKVGRVTEVVAPVVDEVRKPCSTFAVRKSDNGEDNSRILFISDMHVPYHHVDLLDFLEHLKKKYQPTRVICLGDELDKHALSYHDSDPDLPSAGDELKRALPIIKELHGMFPVMDIIESNHGSLVWRKAKTHGIPKHYIKGYNDVLGVGPGWKWSFDLTVKLPSGQGCYVHHGKTADIIKLSQQMGMCAVQGHYHETFKIDYWGNPTGLYWGMQTGCLVDDSSLAFNYNNVNIKRPVIGTGVCIESIPGLEPMVLDTSGRWKGK